MNWLISACLLKNETLFIIDSKGIVLLYMFCYGSVYKKHKTCTKQFMIHSWIKTRLSKIHIIHTVILHMHKLTTCLIHQLLSLMVRGL